MKVAKTTVAQTISDLKLSTRALNCLEKVGTTTLEEFSSTRVRDLMRCRAGWKTIREIVYALHAAGLKLEDDLFALGGPAKSNEQAEMLRIVIRPLTAEDWKKIDASIRFKWHHAQICKFKESHNNALQVKQVFEKTTDLCALNKMFYWARLRYRVTYLLDPPAPYRLEKALEVPYSERLVQIGVLPKISP